MRPFLAVPHEVARLKYALHIEIEEQHLWDCNLAFAVALEKNEPILHQKIWLNVLDQISGLAGTPVAGFVCQILGRISKCHTAEDFVSPGSMRSLSA